MKTMGLAAVMILAFFMFVGCGADATDNNDGGAKAKVTQLVKESIGDQYGPEVAKTVKVHFSTVKEGVTDGRMFLEGSTEFTWKHEGLKRTWDYTKSFQYELQHNGTDWIVRNKLFFDEERTERK